MKTRLLIILCILLLCASSTAHAAAVQVDFLLSGMTDTNGNALEGGLVYTYTAGTTTPATTWTDAAKSTPAANPIVLDAYGRANVYADGIYKFVVKDSDTVTLYTWDNLEYVSTVTPSTISVTTLSATSATIASLTATVAFIAGGDINGVTMANATIAAPEITNASMSAAVLYEPTLYNASLSAPVLSNASLSAPVLSNASLSAPVLSYASLSAPVLSYATVGNPTALGDPSNYVVNKGYVDGAVASLSASSHNSYAVPAGSYALEDFSFTATATPDVFTSGTDITSFNIVNYSEATGTYFFTITYTARSSSAATGLMGNLWAHTGGTVIYDSVAHNAAPGTFTYGVTTWALPAYANGSLSGIVEVAPASYTTVSLRASQNDDAGPSAIIRLPGSGSFFKWFRLR